jgi:hypothetical protein
MGFGIDGALVGAGWHKPNYNWTVVLPRVRPRPDTSFPSNSRLLRMY